jgi:hypothetical protein
MKTTFDDIREAVLHLPKGDQMRLLSLVAQMMTTLIIEQLRNRHHLPLTPESCQFISHLVMREYLDEFNGLQPA